MISITWKIPAICRIMGTSAVLLGQEQTALEELRPG
jgi:hypothetical protein